MKTPTTYSWISRVTSASKAMMRSDGDHRQGDDPVGEDQSVAKVAELAGHQLVPGQDRRQPGKVLVGGVGRQDQDSGRHHLEDPEPDTAIESGPADLGEDGAELVERCLR